MQSSNRPLKMNTDVRGNITPTRRPPAHSGFAPKKISLKPGDLRVLRRPPAWPVLTFDCEKETWSPESTDIESQLQTIAQRVDRVSPADARRILAILNEMTAKIQLIV